MKKLYLLIPGLLTAFSGLYAQTPQGNWPVANNSVNAIVKDGNTIYMGGSFTYVGPNIPYGASIDATSGAPNFNYVKPNGNINAVVPDGSGGWYIGGTFTMVGNQVRNRIARINADGSLNAWNPDADNTVNSIAVSGNTVYIGGLFTMLKTNTTPVSRNRIAAIDATTGDPTSWDPNAGGNVATITVSGSTVYVGGAFTTIGVDNRNRIAAIDAVSGSATAWNPAASISSGSVSAIAVSGTTIFVGGNFGAGSTIGGQSRKFLAALDATTALATSWAPEPGSTISALAINGNTLYVVGGFTTIDAQPRNRIASFDITNLGAIALKSWDPNANSSVNSVAVSGTTVYVGGLFTSIGGQNRNRLAALDASTGNALSWDPSSSGSTASLAVSGSSVYAGGNFVSIGGFVRNGLAAMDASTGAVTSWNPNLSGGTATVNAIVVNGSTVYFGGNFTTVGGTTRNRAGAVDAATGIVTSWDPNINSTVNAMALYGPGNTMYVGGQFTAVNGTTPNRTGLAAFDLLNGTMTSWNPQASSTVNSLLLNGNTLYIGGQFVSFGGGAQLRNRIASYDVSTGTINAWNPNAGASGNVFTMALDNNILYAGGSFTSMGGSTRNRIAAVDASTGGLTAWDPNAGTTQVSTIVVDGATVYAGGTFTTIGGATRNRIAALSATTGTAIAGWDPNANSSVTALMLSGNQVFVGGALTTMKNLPFASLAVLNNVPSTLPVSLLSFNARYISTNNAPKVLCSWETAQEINFSHFIVERSADGIHYSGIGNVTASGDASASHQYGFTDYSPLAGKAYYRLKQVDRDGAYTYSKVVIILGQTDGMGVMLYPNPVKNNATIMIALPTPENVRYTLYDQSGKLMVSQALYLKEGSNAINLPMEQLSAGVYTLVLSNSATIKQLQVVKQ